MAFLKLLENMNNIKHTEMVLTTEIYLKGAQCTEKTLKDGLQSLTGAKRQR